MIQSFPFHRETLDEGKEYTGHRYQIKLPSPPDRKSLDFMRNLCTDVAEKSLISIVDPASRILQIISMQESTLWTVPMRHFLPSRSPIVAVASGSPGYMWVLQKDGKCPWRVWRSIHPLGG